jgi:hypothetical protein
MTLCTPKSHHFSLIPLSLLLFIHYSLHHSTFPCTMTGEADQSSNIIDAAAASDTHDDAVAASGSKGATGAESKIASASSSSNVVVQTMVYHAPTITEDYLTAYHTAGWLPGMVLCSTTPLEFPTIDRTGWLPSGPCSGAVEEPHV